MAKKNEHLVELFEKQYKSFNLPPLQREVKFHPTRKWRFDYGIVLLKTKPITPIGIEILEFKIAIEIEGGTFVAGKHTRPAGYQNDCEKYNEAQRLGWSVLRFTKTDVVEDKVCRYIWNFIYPDNPLF